MGLPVVVALAVAAVILIGGSAGQDRQSGKDPAEQRPQQSTAEEAEQPPSTEETSESEEGVSEGGGEQASGGEETLGTPALGDEGAPVVMVEFSDYQ